MGDENCEDETSDVSLPPSVQESDDRSDNVSLTPLENEVAALHRHAEVHVTMKPLPLA